MKIYGYARVSSFDQNEDKQLDALNVLDIPHGKYILISSQVKLEPPGVNIPIS